jgi:ubiquinone/menaquinone biosynthesis C-methylase UbiE
VSDPGGPPPDPLAAAREAVRHGFLATGFDRGSASIMSRLGLRPGWQVLEVGAGHGSIARWLGEEVAPGGRVVATDVDVRFIGEQPDTVEVRRHDIVGDPLPEGSFDLAHARGVLQHVAQRELALDNMVLATKPRGWVLVEDVDWLVFEQQDLPEPFATLSRVTLDRAATRLGYDAYWGRRMVPAFVAAGLESVESRGRVVAMHGGTPTAEWYVLALEATAPALIAEGAVDQDLVDRALAQARDPGFVVLGPLTISAWGRRPAR